MAAEVSSAPYQVKESESMFKAPSVVQDFSVLLHIWSIRNFGGTVSTPTDGVISHRNALNLLSLSCWVHSCCSQIVKLLPTAAIHYGSQMSSCSYRLLVNFSFSPANLSFYASSWGHPSVTPCCHTVLL